MAICEDNKRELVRRDAAKILDVMTYFITVIFLQLVMV